MMLIPCIPGGVSVWSQRTTLDGVSYTLRFEWNQRAGAWSMDLADVDGVAIASGIVLVGGVRLLARVRDARRPPGDFAIIDTQGNSDPTFTSLGTQHLLVYAHPSEFG